jgi:hypothetical protein
MIITKNDIQMFLGVVIGSMIGHLILKIIL